MLIEAQFWKASFAEEAGDLDGAEKAYRRAITWTASAPWPIFTWAWFCNSRETRPAPDAACTPRSN